MSCRDIPNPTIGGIARPSRRQKVALGRSLQQLMGGRTTPFSLREEIDDSWVRQHATNRDVETRLTSLRTDVNASSDWGINITKLADQAVSESVTLATDNELVFDVQSGEYWIVLLNLFYTASNASCEFKLNYHLPTVEGIIAQRFINAADAYTTSGQSLTAAIAATSLVLGGATTVRAAIIEHQFVAGAIAPFEVTFANNGLTAGSDISTLKAGSTLRARRLWPT